MSKVILPATFFIFQRKNSEKFSLLAPLKNVLDII